MSESSASTGRFLGVDDPLACAHCDRWIDLLRIARVAEEQARSNVRALEATVNELQAAIQQMTKDDQPRGGKWGPAITALPRRPFGERRAMIQIQKSQTADTRTCDFTTVTRETLLESSRQHIRDVRNAHQFFSQKIAEALLAHDTDKITDIDGFHRDFLTGFKETTWWDAHRRLNRHHLTQDDGVPADVNLIDVLDFIADCVMAGMGRSGSVSALHLAPALLERAFQNTVELLKSQVVIEESRDKKAFA